MQSPVEVTDGVVPSAETVSSATVSVATPESASAHANATFTLKRVQVSARYAAPSGGEVADAISVGLVLSMSIFEKVSGSASFPAASVHAPMLVTDWFSPSAETVSSGTVSVSTPESILAAERHFDVESRPGASCVGRSAGGRGRRRGQRRLRLVDLDRPKGGGCQPTFPGTVRASAPCSRQEAVVPLVGGPIFNVFSGTVSPLGPMPESGSSKHANATFTLKTRPVAGDRSSLRPGARLPPWP